MSIAGITSTERYVEPEGAFRRPLPVVRELQRDRDVVGLAERLDHQLQGVLVLADHPELVALDAHLHLRAHVLDPLAQVAGDVLCDAGVELNLDLAATLAD